ncbi:MAG TPA: isoprenylcysteine carboxylmethyltransferase family protein [Myxococcales bacterium]|nr:isoprenylcysteine carboxylmethyltransferase family protein [Myxococcales bacterium]
MTAVLVLLALSAALGAGEIALAPAPRLPLDAVHRRGGWAGPAAITGMGLLALQVAAILFRGQPHLALGSATMISGAALRLWAIRTLGPSFRTEHEVHRGQRLVRSGPYAFSRHPSELGLLAFALGAAAVTGSWPAAALWALVLLPSSLVRIRREEALLRAAFNANG